MSIMSNVRFNFHILTSKMLMKIYFEKTRYFSSSIFSSKIVNFFCNFCQVCKSVLLIYGKSFYCHSFWSYVLITEIELMKISLTTHILPFFSSFSLHLENFDRKMTFPRPSKFNV